MNLIFIPTIIIIPNRRLGRHRADLNTCHFCLLLTRVVYNSNVYFPRIKKKWEQNGNDYDYIHVCPSEVEDTIAIGALEHEQIKLRISKIFIRNEYF